MIDPFAILVALAVPIVVVRYFFRKDEAPVPPARVTRTFALGMTTVVPVFLVGMPLLLLILTISNPVVVGLGMAFLCAAVPEECFKFLVVDKYSFGRQQTPGATNGLVYGLAASLGFAAVENVLYAFLGGVPFILMRSLTAIPMHAALGIIMGLQLGRAEMFGAHGPTPLSRQARSRAIAWPVILHGLYDAPLMIVMIPILRSGGVGGEIPDEKAIEISMMFLLSMLVLGLTLFVAARLNRYARLERQAFRQLQAKMDAGDDGLTDEYYNPYPR
jgi:RsiW-degrading membrane proteinase PrsW (M82 family)